MLKSLTPFVLAFLMMGLNSAPSINGYITTSNLETSTESLMLAGHCNGDHGDGDHGDEEETDEGETSNAGTTYTS
ncbi:MAG: hypothetical protein VXW88_00065 [Pseudomonadota bacterium]|nr:hypothetical protein [Pseudomonadota bacterium]